MEFWSSMLPFSPMEQFQIYKILTLDLTITNLIFYLMIAGLLILLFNAPLIMSSGEIISNFFNILNESLYRSIQILIERSIGSNFNIYLPLLYTVFHIILFSNLLGMIPYSTTTTVEIVMTLTISLTLLLGILLIGILTHNFYLFAAFLPSGTPTFLIPFLVILEILAYFIKILSLGLRLAINLITGHVLTKVIVSFIYSGYLSGTNLIILLLPLILLTAFLALELLIAYLQAYILIYITCITLKDLA